MRRLLILAALLCGHAIAADKAPLTDDDAVGLIKSGHCGSATGEKGTGLGAGSGWVVSPNPAEICVAGDGEIQTIGMKNRGIAARHCIRIEQFGGAPVFVWVYASEPKSLEWKVDGYRRSSMPKGFQFPP